MGGYSAPRTLYSPLVHRTCLYLNICAELEEGTEDLKYDIYRASVDSPLCLFRGFFYRAHLRFSNVELGDSVYVSKDCGYSRLEGPFARVRVIKVYAEVVHTWLGAEECLIT